MFAFVRRWALMPVALLFVSACTAGSASAPSAPSAQGGLSNTTTSAGLGHALFHPLAIHAPPNSAPWLINFVSAGVAQNGVPCISCVSGAQTQDNIGLTGPSSYVPTGYEYQYSLSFTDIAFVGKCKLAWTIVSGKKTIDAFSASLNLTSAGGYVLYALNRSRPNYSGPATLTGKVTCGKGPTQTTQAPLLFQ